MNCERVFELLVDGQACQRPGESAGSMAAAEQRALTVHLLRCPACRQLEQQLAPALGLFQAALNEERESPRGELPQRQKPADTPPRRLASDEAAPAAAWHAVPRWHDAAEENTQRAAHSPQPMGRDFNVTPPLAWWRVAAALLLGFVLAGIVQNDPAVSQRTGDFLMAQADSAAGIPGAVAALPRQLPPGQLADCIPQAALGLGAKGMCCTMCHHAAAASDTQMASTKAPVPATLLASCVVCHTH